MSRKFEKINFFFWSINSLLSLNSEMKILSFERKIIKACKFSFSINIYNYKYNYKYNYPLIYTMIPHFPMCSTEELTKKKQGLHNSNIVSLSNAALERIYFTQPSNLLLLKWMNLGLLLKLITIKLLSNLS